ncbi:MAG: hypothetical protein EA398_03630 [Deltaproteobacteria bacterium]|nr:MAG: hypothetical protein EA398_03630 [Deltaproteobacteria bacterium]
MPTLGPSSGVCRTLVPHRTLSRERRPRGRLRQTPRTMPSHTLSDALAGLIAGCRDTVVPSLASEPLSIPEHLRCIPGVIGRKPVRMRVDAWRGEAWLSLLVADIRSEVDGSTLSATVIGLPHPGSVNPVVGVDLIALGGRLSLYAVDLAPICASWWNATGHGLLLDLKSGLPSSFVERPHPEFTTGTFSSEAIIGRFEPADSPRAVDATAHWLGRLAPALVPGADTADPERASRLGRWLQAERTNRREHNALARIFGEDTAAELTARVLFPDRWLDPGSPPD